MPLEMGIIIAERLYACTRRWRGGRVEIGSKLRVAWHALFDFCDVIATQNLRTQPAGNLTGCRAESWNPLWFLGKRDLTRFRRIHLAASRRCCAFGCLALSGPSLSRQVLVPSALAGGSSGLPQQVRADRIIPALNLKSSMPRLYHHLL